MYVIDTHEELPRFEFKVDGDVYSVPLMDALPADDMTALAKRLSAVSGSEQAVQMVDELRSIFEEHAPGAVARLTRGQWRELASAYMKASEVTAGE